MLVFLSSLVPFFFYVLFFFVPLTLYPYSYELFEFNKMILVYILTILILTSWGLRTVLERKVIFRRTIFDIPLLLFLGSQFISTLTSIDLRTSLFGYYSRFHGGFLSSLCYSLLFWAFVANMDKEKTKKAIRFLLYSGVLVSIYAVLQHFGIDKNVWVQDVQNRVFSTLGQPNWLAAWLLGLLPLTWAFVLKGKRSLKKYLAISLLFTLAIAYTKSRSGLLGLAVALPTFWGLIYFFTVKKKLTKPLKKKFLILNLLTLVLIFVGGTPWSPSLEKLGEKKEEVKIEGPVLETGGTESGKIRKIVWQGAIDIFRHYPLTGTGPETFAFAYYQYRPIEHNLVSEWDFLYNKAHNESLNILATTGILGLATYLYFIYILISFLIKKVKEDPSVFYPAFLASYAGLLITNFFGFSVVATSILFFLFPALAIVLGTGGRVSLPSERKLEVKEKVLAYGILLLGLYLLLAVARYWYADFLFAKAKGFNDVDDPVKARNELVRAISISPREAIFWDELAQSDTLIAVALNEADETKKAEEFAQIAIDESQTAVALSPKNVNLKRSRANIFLKLAALNPAYLEKARDTLLETLILAPTDAKLYYNLGLTYARLGDMDNAVKLLEKAILFKANYKEARLAYALILIDLGDRARAREQLTYILEKIDPDDPIAAQTLEEIK